MTLHGCALGGCDAKVESCTRGMSLDDMFKWVGSQIEFTESEELFEKKMGRSRGVNAWAQVVETSGTPQLTPQINQPFIPAHRAFPNPLWEGKRKGKRGGQSVIAATVWDILPESVPMRGGVLCDLMGGKERAIGVYRV